MQHRYRDYEENRSVLPVNHETIIDDIEVEDQEVIEYLKSVKEEANSITFYPLESIDQDEEEYDDYEDFIENIHISEVIPDNNQEPEFQTQWEKTFLEQFMQLKEIIQNQPHSHKSWTSPETSGQWRKYMTENPPPSYDIIRGIDHVTTIRLIANLTSWLSTKVNDNLSLWIYTLFLRIDNVLDYNDCAIIRGLGKKALRLSTVSEPSNCSPTAQYTFKFILLIMYHYYHQKDIRVIN